MPIFTFSSRLREVLDLSVLLASSLKEFQNFFGIKAHILTDLDEGDSRGTKTGLLVNPRGRDVENFGELFDGYEIGHIL